MNTQRLQLPLQTLSLTVGFAYWVLISALIVYIKGDIPLTPSQSAWVTAIPVLFGSILRIPIGYLTNRLGARVVFTSCFLISLFPIYWLSRANSFQDLIVAGMFLGIGGGVFSIGVTSLPRYYPKEKQGFVNGIYGIGNLGTAITNFSAPVLANMLGWTRTIWVFGGVLVLFIVLHIFGGDRQEQRVNVSLIQQIKGVYRNEKLWLICLFYFITFGSFVAFTVYLPTFLVNHFHLEKVDAGIRTAGFIALATFMRPIGGWLGDRINAFKILMAVFGGLAIAAIILSFSPSIGLYTAGCLLVAFCAGTGNGAIFKLVPMYFSKQAGIANGLISAMGGLGGFFPPLILTWIFQITGHYSIGFMALSEVALASLILVIWLYFQDRMSLQINLIKQTKQSIMVTNPEGIIQFVNEPFTEVTGYSYEEAVGQNPRFLKSGKQSERFYQTMWEQIRAKGSWQGAIWNKRKNGEIYQQWLTIQTIYDDDGEVKQYAALFSDMSNAHGVGAGQTNE